MKELLTLGIIHLYITLFVLINKKVPDAIYFSPLLNEYQVLITSVVTGLFSLACFYYSYKIYKRDK